MNSKKEKLEDYAVDVQRLKGIHQQIVAKRNELTALVAEEQGLGPIEAMSKASKERLKAEVKARLKAEVDRLLDEWEREKSEDGTVATGSAAFNKLAQEHFDLEQQILNAEDEQVEEATEHPFDHPLR